MARPAYHPDHGHAPELDDKPHPVRADVAYLSKPFDMDDLRQIIASMLAARRTKGAV